MSKTTSTIAVLAVCAAILSSGSLSASGSGGGHESGSAEKHESDVSKHASSSGGNSSGSAAKHWTYTGETGAEHWGSLAKEYSLCGSGRVQSPIDIDGSVSANSFDLNFSYQDVPLQILNNGHTIQINYSTESHDEDSNVYINGEKHALPSAIQYNSGLSISGEYYKLLHVNFHSPSEHHVDGKPYAMEAHFVHMNSQGQHAVVGVTMKRGSTNRFLDQLWSHMPTTKSGPNTISGVSVNAHDLLPHRKSYYHYRGSLTTPPCSEGVRWFVLKESIEVSDAQVERFLSVIGHNARPVQPINHRPLIRTK